jgi:hypothetical protein
VWYAMNESHLHFCFTQRRWVRRKMMKLLLMIRIFRCNLFRFSPFSQSLSVVHWLSMLHWINIGNYGNRLTTKNTPMPKNTFGMKYSFSFRYLNFLLKYTIIVVLSGKVIYKKFKTTTSKLISVFTVIGSEWTNMPIW